MDRRDEWAYMYFLLVLRSYKVGLSSKGLIIDPDDLLYALVGPLDICTIRKVKMGLSTRIVENRIQKTKNTGQKNERFSWLLTGRSEMSYYLFPRLGDVGLNGSLQNIITTLDKKVNCLNVLYYNVSIN